MRTYTARPERGNARKAWDYFVAKYPTWPIRKLYYSPNCYGVRSWICEFVMSENATDHWGMSYYDSHTKNVPCSYLD